MAVSYTHLDVYKRQVYTCPGWCAVDGRIFRCAGGIPHGEVDLAGALEKSCNGYFIRLGQALGADAVRAMAEQLRCV